jgi:hypothetical protein
MIDIEERKIRKKKWDSDNYIKNKESMKKRIAEYKSTRREEINSKQRQYEKDHPEKNLENKAKYRKELRDSYLKDMIKTQLNVRNLEIPNEMIEAHRLQIQIKRLIKEKQNENTTRY